MAPLDGSSLTISRTKLTLRLAREHVEARTDWSPTRKRDLRSGLSSFARHLGLSDDDEISLTANAERIEAFVPASAGITKTTWATILSAVAAVVRSCQNLKKPSLADLLPEWHELRSRIPACDLQTIRGLSTVFHFASREGTPVDRVDEAFFARLSHHLMTSTRLTPRRASIKFGRILKTWNDAAKRHAFWPPAVHVEQPSRRSPTA